MEFENIKKMARRKGRKVALEAVFMNWRNATSWCFWIIFIVGTVFFGVTAGIPKASVYAIFWLALLFFIFIHIYRVETKEAKEFICNLQRFNLVELEKIRYMRGEMESNAGRNKIFWEELEEILSKEENYCISNSWTRRDNDDVILGEVWEQPIGEFQYKYITHSYTYMYIGTEGLVIDLHGHNKKVNKGRGCIKKSREWYIFPDGSMRQCGKGETHTLYNNFGGPIYVISLKITKKTRYVRPSKYEY